MEDDLSWKMNFCGRHRSVEDDLWWKTTFDGKRPSVEDNFWWKMIIACCLVCFAAFLMCKMCNVDFLNYEKCAQ